MDVNWSSIRVGGVDLTDWPDFCDAYIEYAEWEDGTPLTDEERDMWTDERRDIVYEKALEEACNA